MKSNIQQFIPILAGMLAVSSCSQEATQDYPDSAEGRRIVFHTSLPGISTKATEIAEDLGYFHVTAFDQSDFSLISGGILNEYIGDVRISKDEAGNSYRSDLCAWPLPGRESDLLHFFAYYPQLPSSASISNRSVLSESGLEIDYKVDAYRVASEIADQVDFVAAYATGSMEENLFSGIQLDFSHMLSRIEVMAWGANKSCDIEIAGVRIGATGVEDAFSFQPSENAGVWTGRPTTGMVEYVYRNGDKILALDKKEGSPMSEEAAISIMGSPLGDNNNNCAMLIPASYGGWRYSDDPHNTQSGMYLSVLLRVTDATSSGDGSQIYPYADASQGTVWLTVDKATGKTVGTRLYLKDGAYFSDSACTLPYSIADNEEVKAFGWAALPISGDWEAGCIYTYTLDYTYGVGLHGPDTPDDEDIKAGDPIISDKVGVAVSVRKWQAGGQAAVEVPGS